MWSYVTALLHVHQCACAKWVWGVKELELLCSVLLVLFNNFVPGLPSYNKDEMAIFLQTQKDCENTNKMPPAGVYCLFLSCRCWGTGECFFYEEVEMLWAGCKDVTSQFLDNIFSAGSDANCVSDDPGFPMSQFLKPFKLHVSRNATMVAQQVSWMGTIYTIDLKCPLNSCKLMVFSLCSKHFCLS